MGPGVELGVGDPEERLEEPLVEDRHRELAPGARRPGGPRDGVEPVGAQGEHGGGGPGDDTDRPVGRAEVERVRQGCHLEPSARGPHETIEIEALDVVNEPVVREDREARRLEREERHQLPCRLGVAPRILDGRLVPVVPVGDEDRPQLHQLLHARDACLVRDPPEAVELALKVARLGDRLALGRRGAQELALGVAHQHEEESEVRARRGEQVQTVLLRPRVGPLVREHAAMRVLAHFAQRDEPAPREHLAAHTVRLGVGIDRGALLAPPDPARQPGVEDLARAGVLVDTPLVPGERRAHDVLRAHRIEALRALGTDLVVRRRDDRRHIAARAEGVAVAAERLDVHAQWPPPAGPCPLTTSAARAAGGVLRLRPMVILPSISTIEIPGRSPALRADNASHATLPVGASQMTRSASRPSAMTPTLSLYTRAVLPVAHPIACAGSNPPSPASRLSVRSTPSGITPVPDGASFPMMIRWVARASVATRSVWRAVFMFPHCTISSAICVATRRSISCGVIDVVPPLMWPTTSGSASSTTSALIGLEPAIDGPPVWIVTVIPCCFAHRTIGAASLPVFTEPSPISPTSFTPAAAISAKSASSRPSSRIGAPACTFTPPGRKFAHDFAATMA